MTDTETPPPEESPPPPTDNLIRLLLDLATRVQYNSEEEQAETMHLLRHVEEDLGAGGIVPPERVDANAPAAAAAVPPPGPVAEPVPADAQPPPPTSPEVAGAAPEQTNAFSDPGAA
jgi:hypothetical protein